ncbi:MAG: nitrate reductase associated protein [Aphanocapsa sp. GSE-SYN-MK-11-07L]|nr:nitrate reductase associated protein [Aphanocapsa sp. GSE-SYN-MK-11-07L]
MAVNSDRHFFQFEADFVESLRCIPIQVRLKLDTCGIKRKVSEWNRFSEESRLNLIEIYLQTGDTVVQTLLTGKKATLAKSPSNAVTSKTTNVQNRVS